MSPQHPPRCLSAASSKPLMKSPKAISHLLSLPLPRLPLLSSPSAHPDNRFPTSLHPAHNLPLIALCPAFTVSLHPPDTPIPNLPTTCHFILERLKHGGALEEADARELIHLLSDNDVRVVYLRMRVKRIGLELLKTVGECLGDLCVLEIWGKTQPLQVAESPRDFVTSLAPLQDLQHLSLSLRPNLGSDSDPEPSPLLHLDQWRSWRTRERERAFGVGGAWSAALPLLETVELGGGFGRRTRVGRGLSRIAGRRTPERLRLRVVRYEAEGASWAWVERQL